MSVAQQNIRDAHAFAMSIRPKVGGFPYLAEVFRQAGVTHNRWSLPSCQTIYITSLGSVVQQLPPLVVGAADIPAFDRDALIRALRVDQAGESTFPEFLQATWQAGVVGYDVDFVERHVTYVGVNGETYIEAYAAVTVNWPR